MDVQAIMDNNGNQFESTGNSNTVNVIESRTEATEDCGMISHMAQLLSFECT